MAHFSGFYAYLVFVAMSLPAIYIATISFHYELIPLDLVLP